MMREKHLVLFLVLLTISSCQTPSNYFNRPKVEMSINNECTAYRDGELIDATNFISVSPEEFDILLDYADKREYCNYICIKYPRRCKGCK